LLLYNLLTRSNFYLLLLDKGLLTFFKSALNQGFLDLSLLVFEILLPAPYRFLHFLSFDLSLHLLFHETLLFSFVFHLSVSSDLLLDLLLFCHLMAPLWGHVFAISMLVICLID
jgi:hypothetical protein